MKGPGNIKHFRSMFGPNTVRRVLDGNQPREVRTNGVGRVKTVLDRILRTSEQDWGSEHRIGFCGGIK